MNIKKSIRVLNRKYLECITYKVYLTYGPQYFSKKSIEITAFYFSLLRVPRITVFIKIQQTLLIPTSLYSDFVYYSNKQKYSVILQDTLIRNRKKTNIYILNA